MYFARSVDSLTDHDCLTVTQEAANLFVVIFSYCRPSHSGRSACMRRADSTPRDHLSYTYQARSTTPCSRLHCDLICIEYLPISAAVLWEHASDPCLHATPHNPSTTSSHTSTQQALLLAPSRRCHRYCQTAVIMTSQRHHSHDLSFPFSLNPCTR